MTKKLTKTKARLISVKYGKNTTKLPREGYIARAVREYHKNLEGLKNDDPIMKKAVKLGKRCHYQQMRNQLDIVEPPTKSKFRNPGGGRKVTAPGVREALDDRFIDVRGSLKARLPRSLLKTGQVLL